MPRYLAWIAALGYVGEATWAPAVAGELARRLAWWNLTPHPERGSGRLLWLLERLLEPENRKARMADLWSRAKKAGFNSPDGISARPRNVDVSAEAFSDLVLSRRPPTLAIGPPGAHARNRSKASRVTAMSNTGVVGPLPRLGPRKDGWTFQSLLPAHRTRSRQTSFCTRETVTLGIRT